MLAVVKFIVDVKHVQYYNYDVLMFRKVSRERSISTPSIINSLTGARDRTYSEESRFSRSQSPHSRTTGATTPTTAILDVPT